MAKIKQILTNYKFFFFTILCFVIISILVFDYLKKNTKQLLTEIKSLKVENTVSNRQIAKIEKS